MTEPVSRRRPLGGALALGARGTTTGLHASGCGAIASAGTRVRFRRRIVRGIAHTGLGTM